MAADSQTTPRRSLRARLSRALLRGTGFTVVPNEASDAMVIACLKNSIAIMRRDGLTALYPDDPAPRPTIVTRSAWRAMVEASDAES